MTAKGLVHAVPSDLKKALESNPAVLDKWNSLTPIERNEWICWVISVKKEETRKNHIIRTISQIKEGDRKPCCFIGCIHRKDKKISPSVAGILARKAGKKP